MTTLSNPTSPPEPEQQDAPRGLLTAEEERDALLRALSAEEADVVLRAECPALTDVILSEQTIIVRRGSVLPGVRVRMCTMSTATGVGQRQVIWANDWNQVLNEARAQFGSDR